MVHLHGQPDEARRGFSLVELLVVVAIVGMLLALVLPSMVRSREVAREAKCMGNMRQVYTAGGAFSSDQGAIMPNSVHRNYPNGFLAMNYPPAPGAPAATRWMPSDAGNTISFAQLLIMGSYLPDARVRSNLGYPAIAARGKSSVFFCPSMFTGFTNTYYDTREGPGTNKVTDDLERRSAYYWFDTDGTGTTTALRLANGYQVNELAGGQGQYLVVSADSIPNRGFYKRKRWKSHDETRIGYLFENFMWTTGGVAQYVANINTGTSTFGSYGPPIRHNALTSTNLVYADGHAVRFPTPTFASASLISDPNAPVSFLFE